MSEIEADTSASRIHSILRDAGWGVAEGSKVHRELRADEGTFRPRAAHFLPKADQHKS